MGDEGWDGVGGAGWKVEGGEVREGPADVDADSATLEDVDLGVAEEEMKEGFHLIEPAGVAVG
jgi:hypothetical protein